MNENLKEYADKIMAAWHLYYDAGDAEEFRRVVEMRLLLAFKDGAIDAMTRALGNVRPQEDGEAKENEPDTLGEDQ